MRGHTPLVAIVVGIASPASAGALFGAQLDIVSGGSLDVVAADRHMSYELASSLGVGGLAGYRSGWLSIALAPRYVPDLHAQLDPNGGISQIDLGIRIAGHYDVARDVELVGFVTPAYSILYGNDGAAGPAMLFGAGVSHRMGGALVAGAISYEAGDQRSTLGATVASHLWTFTLAVSTN